MQLGRSQQLCGNMGPVLPVSGPSSHSSRQGEKKGADADKEMKEDKRDTGVREEMPIN